MYIIHALKKILACIDKSKAKEMVNYMHVQCRVLNGTRETRWPATKARGGRPTRSAQSSRCQPPGRAARLRSSRQSLNEHCMHRDRVPDPIEAINGAARRRTEAAHARRRKASEHGAHHVARAAPAARAGSKDDAAVRVHRRRTDQGGHGAPLLRPGRGARPGRTQLVSLAHDNSTPWARAMEPCGAAVGRPPTIFIPDSKTIAARGRADESTHPLLSLLCLCFCFSFFFLG